MLFRNSSLNISSMIRRLSHIESEVVPKLPEPSQQLQIINTDELPNDDFIETKFERKSVLEKCDEDISYVAPYLKPSFNFAAYVNKSETLQQLVKLGVSLHKLERKAEIVPYILGLDFEKDIKNHVIFLSDLGVSVEELGAFITKNPFIFKEDIENLVIRVNYLKSKKFSDEMITRIVSKNPYWLLFSTQRIDRKLGFFQKEFSLTGNEVRTLTTQQPRLITYSIQHVKLNTFALKEEMGFTPEETKSVLLKKPYIFMKAQDQLLKTFEFVHKNMKVPVERIAETPEVLTCRQFKVKQRHLFLEMLGRAQYNHMKPNYVSLVALVSGSDAQFCSDVAKSTIQTFNTFLKSF